MVCLFFNIQNLLFRTSTLHFIGELRKNATTLATFRNDFAGDTAFGRPKWRPGNKIRCTPATNIRSCLAKLGPSLALPVMRRRVGVYRIVIRRQQQCQRASKSTKQGNFTWTTRQSNLFRTTSAPATPASSTRIKSPGKFYKSLATSQL